MCHLHRTSLFLLLNVAFIRMVGNFACFPPVHAFVGYYFELSAVLFTIQLNYFYWTARFSSIRACSPPPSGSTAANRSWNCLQKRSDLALSINHALRAKPSLRSKNSQCSPQPRWQHVGFCFYQSFDTVPWVLASRGYRRRVLGGDVGNLWSNDVSSIMAQPVEPAAWHGDRLGRLSIALALN